MSHWLTRSCRATLEAWKAPDAAQDGLRRDFVGHLSAHEDGWSRRCHGAHLTASALVCDADRGRVLLTLHARIGRWLQTGGHLEDGDTGLVGAALREAAEETGLASLVIDPTPLLLSRHTVPCGPVRPTYHLDVQFLARVDTPGDVVVSAESDDLRWFERDVLPTADESVVDLVAAASLRLGW